MTNFICLITRLQLHMLSFVYFFQFVAILTNIMEYSTRPRRDSGKYFFFFLSNITCIDLLYPLFWWENIFLWLCWTFSHLVISQFKMWNCTSCNKSSRVLDLSAQFFQTSYIVAIIFLSSNYYLPVKRGACTVGHQVVSRTPRK